VSLSGYVLRVAFGVPADGFALVHAHPLLSGIPRFTETLLQSPQHAGEVLAVVLACACFLAARSERRDKRAWVGLAAMILLTEILTFSFAWIASAIMLVGVVGRSRRAVLRVAVPPSRSVLAAP